MDLNRSSTSDSTKPDAQRILGIATAYRESRALMSAVELGVFTELAKNPNLSAKELASKVGVHPRGALDFFDALCAIGFLVRDENYRYRNSANADYYLDRQKPSYIGGSIDFLSKRGYVVWEKLTAGLTSGKRQSGGLDIDDQFSAIYEDPKQMRIFLHGMTASTLRVARVISQNFPWSRYTSFIDVGCAEGALSVQIAQDHKHLAGGGFDLPIVRPFFEEYVKSFCMDHRLKFFEGDFFKDKELPGADVIVMGRILHDWGLEEKKMLIRKVFEALPEGGAFIAYDYILDDERKENVEGLFLSLSMLLETNSGFEYTESDGRKWLSEAGFSKIYNEHLIGPTSMLVGMK